VSGDLMKFLRARLDEDQAVAERASGGEWGDIVPEQPFVVFDVQAHRNRKTHTTVGAVASVQRAEDRAHIARQDPARVQREVDAKRRLLDDLLPLLEQADRLIEGEYGSGDDVADRLLRLLALPYATHPDYDPEWS
jgi:hypothetical protein